MTFTANRIDTIAKEALSNLRNHNPIRAATLQGERHPQTDRHHHGGQDAGRRHHPRSHERVFLVLRVFGPWRTIGPPGCGAGQPDRQSHQHLYGGGTGQLRAQFIGSITCLVVVGGFAYLVMSLIKMIRGSWTLRVAGDGELEGLDLHEHGTAAYHVEFGQGMTYSTPANSPFTGLEPSEGSWR